MQGPSFVADKENYRRAGFVLLENADASVTIVPTVLSPEPPSLPPVGTPFDSKNILFVQCGLNIGLWGPLGNFIVDPSEKGLVFHAPSIHSGLNQISMTLLPNGRLLRRFGTWLIDIVYWLDEASTALIQQEFDKVFNEVNRRGVLVLERRIRHKVPAYSSPYKVTFREDGCIDICLKESWLKRLFDVFRKWKRVVPKEVSVTFGKLEWTGIEIKFKK